MRRKYVMGLVFILLSVIFVSCATAASKKQQEEIPYVANFTYTSESQATPALAGVTFAVNVNYQSNCGTVWLTWPQFANLDAAMKKDLSNIFEEKGITVRGFFDSHDLIPYQDKKASNLYAVPTLELSVTAPVAMCSYTVSGKFTLALKEIMTGELMWSKTIPLTSFDFQRMNEGFRCNPKDDRLIVDLNAGGRNDVAKGVEKQYPDLMVTLAKLIDPEEMMIIKKQCQEIRSKKGY